VLDIQLQHVELNSNFHDQLQYYHNELCCRLNYVIFDFHLFISTHHHRSSSSSTIRYG
jgi:hypothetical protein